MIIGIGSDLIDIRRVEKVMERHGERFLGRIFTEQERARAERRSANPPQLCRDLCQAVCRQGGLLKGARDRHPPGRLVAGHGGGQPARAASRPWR